MVCIRFCSLFFFLSFLALPTIFAQTVEERQAQLASTDPYECIGALHQLVIDYQNINLDTALLYSRQAVVLSQNVDNDSLLAVSHSRMSTSFYHLRQMDSLLFHASKAAAVAERAEQNKLQAFALKMEGIGHNHLGNFEQATTSNQKALAVYQDLQDSSGIAATYANLGRIYQKQAQYDKALAHFIKAEKGFEQMRDSYGRSVTAAQIGDLFLDMEAPDKAIGYFQKSLRLTSRDSFPIHYGDLLIELGNVYHQDSSQIDSAQFYFNESLLLFEKVGDTQGIAICHNNLGNVDRDKRQWSSAFAHLRKSQAIIVANNWLPMLAKNAKDLGLTHQLNGQQDSAIHYFLQAYKISEDVELAFQEEGILESLYNYYKSNKQSAEALRFYEKLTQLREDTKGEAVQKEIATLEARYENEKKELRIAQLETQGKLDKAKANTIIMGLVGTLILLALGAGFLFYRRHNERKLYTLQQQLHAKEKQELDQEINYKTKQLTSHALHMVQKNKVLQEIKQGIGDLAMTADSTQKKALRSLIRRIDFNIQADEDWETFKLYFEQTNQHFYDNLAKVNSQLTSTELKLCSLIKLNLNIKETASVLNIEPTSVKTARHRLRKKLQLEPGQDLTSFIRQVA